jgi:hypothetical protein
MKPTVDIHFIFLDMLRSSTLEHPLDALLELHRFVISMSASQLESHPQVSRK